MGMFDNLGHLGVDVKALESRVGELMTIQQEMMAMGVSVSEIYSPPRVIKLAEKFGLQKGMAFVRPNYQQ